MIRLWESKQRNLAIFVFVRKHIGKTPDTGLSEANLIWYGPKFFSELSDEENVSAPSRGVWGHCSPRKCLELKALDWLKMHFLPSLIML